MFGVDKITSFIVLDDFMDEASDDKTVSKLFTKGRHDNMSVIYLTQNLFHAKQRNISLNSDYMIIFKNVRDKSQFTHLAKQFMPNNIKFLQWVYKDATEKSHSYVFLDMKPETEDKLRIQSNILPGQEPHYVYVPSSVFISRT
jgi:hypothetical protein